MIVLAEALGLIRRNSGVCYQGAQFEAARDAELAEMPQFEGIDLAPSKRGNGGGTFATSGAIPQK